MKLRSIEIEQDGNFSKIWILIFSTLKIQIYKKNFILLINDEKSTGCLMEIFFLNYYYFKNQFFSENCLDDIECLHMDLIESFPNIPASLITNVIECFGMGIDLFPQFIMNLIENANEFDEFKLKQILENSNALNYSLEFYPDKPYFEIINEFLKWLNQFYLFK